MQGVSTDKESLNTEWKNADTNCRSLTQPLHSTFPHRLQQSHDLTGMHM